MRLVILLFFSLSIAKSSYGQQKTIPQNQSTLFTISAVDDKTSDELAAQFTIRAILAKKKFDGQSKPGGKPYSFLLNRADTLTVFIKSPGYYDTEEIMAISCDTCADYAYVVRLEKDEAKSDSIFRNLQVNKTFRLDNVYFDQSSYVLRSESYPQLNKLIKTLRAVPKLAIEIAGHTDNVGDRRLNQYLSENRAKVIRTYLISNGIADARLRASGYGDTRPAAPNDSEENKRKNRRVEFVVLAL